MQTPEETDPWGNVSKNAPNEGSVKMILGAQRPLVRSMVILKKA
jgi:hypothetical protein